MSIVITARGERLNMAELIMRSKQVVNEEKVTPRKPPARQINVRGFMPSAEGVPTRPMAAKSDEVKKPAPSLADLTAVKVDKPTRLRGKVADPAAAVDETLAEIMGDLEQHDKRTKSGS